MYKAKLLVIIISSIFLGCEGPLFNVPEDQDLIPPTLTITFPPDQAELSDTVLVSAYAFDNVELELVTIYLNDSVIHESKDGPYIYNWATMDSDEDEYHTIRARAVDTTGNINYTGPIQVLINNIDNINPTGSFIYPLDGQQVSGEVNITIEANDNEAISQIVLYINGETIDTLYGPQYNYFWNTNELEENSLFSIYANIIDDEGNLTTIMPINVTINNYDDENMDIIPPVASLLYPVSLQTVSDSVVISGFANDNDGIASVSFFLNGELFSTILDTPYSVLWVTNLENNYTQHSIQMIAEDLTGNQTVTQPILVTVINNYSDTITTLNAVSDENIITLNWDIPSGAESYRIYRNNNFLTQTSQNEYEDFVVSIREYCYRVSAINNANLEGPLSSEECITPSIPPAPELSYSIHGTTVFLNWTSIITAASYRIYQNDIFFIEVEGITHSLEINPEINSCFTVAAVNSYGSEGELSNELCIEVIPPSAPTLSLNINGTIATLNWTSVPTAITYRIYQDNLFIIEQTEISYTQDLGTGNNTCFVVTAVDSYGLESSNSNEECGQGG